VNRRTAPVLLFLPILFASCTLKLIADYDEVIDREATQLQVQMDRHLTELEASAGTTEAAYDQNASFYRDYSVRVRSLRIRAGGHEKNDITLQQLDLLQSSLEDLWARHQEGGTLSAGYVQVSRELFNTAWGAIIRLEIAKKRGEG
jgi:hypothetical protein